MNKDQLLDAIGMVDEQKIRDAVMVKRTKWVSGILTLLVILFVLVLPMLLSGYLGLLFHKAVIDYSPSHIARDIDNANVVTVVPDPTDRQSRYTIYVPDGTSKAMRFKEWSPADLQKSDNREILLTLNFHDLLLQFYDGGYVRAEKHDWDDYIGVYTVPEDLRRELLTFLAKE